MGLSTTHRFLNCETESVYVAQSTRDVVILNLLSPALFHPKPKWDGKDAVGAPP